MRKSYAKQLKEGPVFRIGESPILPGWPALYGKGKGITPDWCGTDNWSFIGILAERKYANMLIKAITLHTRRKR